MSKKTKTIFDEYEEDMIILAEKLKERGVKEKTVKMVLKDIKEYDNKVFKEGIINAFANIISMVEGDK